MSVEPPPSDLLHLVSRDDAGARIRFGDCETVVSLRVSTDGKGVVRVAQSHWIHPPDTVWPRRVQSFEGLAARHALGAAIGGLSSQFRRGLSQGHRPDESWFVSVPSLVGAG